MAIQNRRGAFKDFNPNKLQPGEWATVLEGDPNSQDGKSTYLGYGNGIVKRMATYEDMQENIDNATNEIVTELTTEVNKATANANAATTKANDATKKANASATKADTATANANAATLSANTATSKANSSATKADTAATNAQKIADTVQQKLDNGELKGEPGDISNIDSQPIANVIKTANGSTVIPVAMQKFLNIGATNGPLIIELPVGFNGGIISFDIVISNNTDDDLVRYSIVGQLYTANGGTWTNETRAEASGMAKTDKDDLTVRFGYTANKEKAIIAIGDDSTTWQIPMITIRDFVVYFIKTDMSLWRNGWDCKIGKLSDYTWQRVQEHPNPLKISQETIDLFKSLGFDPNGGVLNSLVNFIFDRMHPIGSYYISDDNKNPETIFGGTWEKITDRFLYASGSKAVGNVGGEETHVLSGAEMPSHTHPFNATTNVATLKGSISEMASQSKNIDINASGCFSSFQSGASRSYGTSVEESANDSVNFNGNHNHSVGGTTGATGSSKAHNNMPPYLVVNIWKRIA